MKALSFFTVACAAVKDGLSSFIDNTDKSRCGQSTVYIQGGVAHNSVNY